MLNIAPSQPRTCRSTNPRQGLGICSQVPLHPSAKIAIPVHQFYHWGNRGTKKQSVTSTTQQWPLQRKRSFLTRAACVIHDIYRWKLPNFVENCKKKIVSTKTEDDSQNPRSLLEVKLLPFWTSFFPGLISSMMMNASPHVWVFSVQFAEN